MIQLRSVLVPADNSGAKKLRVVQVQRGFYHKFGGLGDTVIASVDQADPNGAVKDGEVVRAVVVRIKKESRRPDGSYIRFDDNAAVVIDKEGEPRGTRIFGPIAREIRDLGYMKIASLAKEIV